ncbi:hypothetical protein JCM9803A_02340 [Rhodococcus erythropolis]
MTDPMKEIQDIDEREWRRVCSRVEVPEDEGFRFGTLPPVAVFTDGDEYFCLDDTCTHEDYSLWDGWVEDGAVECTLHLARFDLRTGEPLRPPATVAVAVHPVQVVGDDVYVALPNTYLVKG